MLTASLLLLVMGLLGAFDIAYFHAYRAKLTERPESRTEAWIHVARGAVYGAQFAIVPNLRMAGAWYAALVGLFVVDVAIALSDVLVEPASRRSQGGLPAGEYLMHMILSVMAGALLHAIATSTAGWRALPTGIAIEPHAPAPLRLALGGMSAGSLAVAALEVAALVEASLPRPPPVHVSVRLRAPLQAVWDLTQDHRLHPVWDHRFSRIEMLSAQIRTGTRMLYEKRMFGLTIRGWGRYKLHRPVKQSTFEFGSDDRRSLIRRGVGLWLYRDVAPGVVELSTSYTYDVRWGAFGRVLDRLVFRPLFQRETERSFRRLAERYFPRGRERVLGAEGRKPARLARARGAQAVA
jgi:hypothetical protein